MSKDIKKIVKVSSLSIFFIFIIIYAFFISKDLIFGVKIRNVNIQDGTTISENVIKITGNAKNAVKLTLNGREISIDQDGNFNETISLLLGYNIVTIKAEDKFGYIDEENYKLMH
jgi:hypothetical protein